MDARRKYLKMLRVELTDLQEDIEVIITASQKRMEHAEISRYVFFENMAVMKNEVLGIANVSGIIDSVNPADYEDLDAMVKVIDQRFADTLKEHGFPAGVYRLIKRKLFKLADYVRCEP